MPLPLPNNLIIEKNKIASSVPQIEILEIQSSELAQVIRLADSNMDITWQSETWQAFIFEGGDTVESQEGEAPELEIKVSNVDQSLQKMVEDTDDGLIGDTVIWRLINPDLPTSQALRTENFEIKHIEFDYEWGYFTLGAPNYYLYRFPIHTYSRGHCRYVDKFKEDPCNYSGSQTVCDGTFWNCIFNNNTARFGGQPAIPNGTVQIQPDFARFDGTFTGCYTGQQISIQWGAAGSPQLFNGNVITVGNDGACTYDYSDFSPAYATAVDGDMILVYPDSGGGAYVTGTINLDKTIIVRGMGTDMSSIFTRARLVSEANPFMYVQDYSMNILFENIEILPNNFNAINTEFHACQQPETNVYLNKVYQLAKTGAGWCNSFTNGTTYKGDVYFSNVSFWPSNTHFHGAGDNPGSVYSNVRGEFVSHFYFCRDCASDPNPNDYVEVIEADIGTEDGYGMMFGNFFVKFLI